MAGTLQKMIATQLEPREKSLQRGDHLPCDTMQGTEGWKGFPSKWVLMPCNSLTFHRKTMRHIVKSPGLKEPDLTWLEALWKQTVTHRKIKPKLDFIHLLINMHCILQKNNFKYYSPCFLLTKVLCLLRYCCVLTSVTKRQISKKFKQQVKTRISSWYSSFGSGGKEVDVKRRRRLQKGQTLAQF